MVRCRHSETGCTSTGQAPVVVIGCMEEDRTPEGAASGRGTARGVLSPVCCFLFSLIRRKPIMHRQTSSARRGRAWRRPHQFLPRVELLEDRLPPGDAFLGWLLMWPAAGGRLAPESPARATPTALALPSLERT